MAGLSVRPVRPCAPLSDDMKRSLSNAMAALRQT